MPEKQVEVKDENGRVLYGNKPLEFDTVFFRNGYQKNSPFFIAECKGIKIGFGKPKWGAKEGENYFWIIKYMRKYFTSIVINCLHKMSDLQPVLTDFYF